MGNSCAHGTWIVLKNNTPNAFTTTVSNFKFEEWGDWADRPDHKCDKRIIKANETMEEFFRIARGVKSNKWTLTLTFTDDTKLVLRIDQRYVNMQVKHWQWIEGLNHPPLIEGGDEDLYKICYEIDWDLWKIIIIVSKKTEEERGTEVDKEKLIAAKEAAEKKDIKINYFAEPEQVISERWKTSAKETILMRSRERAKRKADEKAKIKLMEEEKRESWAQANKKVKENGSNWKDWNDIAYFLRGYPLLNYFAFLIVMYLFYFIMLFYFSIYLNVSYDSTEA